jgi:hypothetical protein
VAAAETPGEVAVVATPAAEVEEAVTPAVAAGVETPEVVAAEATLVEAAVAAVAAGAEEAEEMAAAVAGSPQHNVRYKAG